MFDARVRDRLVADFRRKVYDQIQFAPLYHQADWQVASEGWMLVDAIPQPGDHYIDISVGDPSDTTYIQEQRHQQLMIVKRQLVPRMYNGTVAHHLTNLSAFKGGKSYGMAAWATGFALLPEAKLNFVGLEYATSENEFSYLIEFLCSERGMNMKYDQCLNDPRGGRMRLALRSGALFEAKSWKQKEQLKGAKMTAYIYTEAYQLPGLVCYTSVRQNLRQLKGFAVWGTTPDRPWVGFLHDQGHGANPDWHCTCGVKDDANPVTFDQKARDAADPEKGGVMTREKFAIAHNGTLGTFVGKVYTMPRGSHQFSPVNHPSLWKPEIRDIQP